MGLSLGVYSNRTLCALVVHQAHVRNVQERWTHSLHAPTALSDPENAHTPGTKISQWAHRVGSGENTFVSPRRSNLHRYRLAILRVLVPVLPVCKYHRPTSGHGGQAKFGINPTDESVLHVTRVQLAHAQDEARGERVHGHVRQEGQHNKAPAARREVSLGTQHVDDVKE